MTDAQLYDALFLRRLPFAEDSAGAARRHKYAAWQLDRMRADDGLRKRVIAVIRDVDDYYSNGTNIPNGIVKS